MTSFARGRGPGLQRAAPRRGTCSCVRRQQPRAQDVGLRLAQRVGLGFAARFRHRLGEVGEQHREPQPERNLTPNIRPAPPVTRSRRTNSVVSAAPTSTTNITGFFTSVAGLSLMNDSHSALDTIAGSNSERARDSFVGSSDVSPGSAAGGLGAVIVGVVTAMESPSTKAWPGRTAVPGSSGSARRLARATTPGRTSGRRRSARSRRGAPRTGGRASAACRWSPGRAFSRQAAGRREERQQEQEAADDHRQPMLRLYQGVLALMPAKALPLLPVPLVYAYRISANPCGPALLTFAAAGPGGFQ